MSNSKLPRLFMLELSRLKSQHVNLLKMLMIYFSYFNGGTKLIDIILFNWLIIISQILVNK